MTGTRMSVRRARGHRIARRMLDTDRPLRSGLVLTGTAPLRLE